MGTDRAGQIYFYAPNFSDAQFYLLSRSGAQNQTHCAHLIEKQLEKIIFVLCYTATFIFIVVSSKVFAMRPLQCECCLND